MFIQDSRVDLFKVNTSEHLSALISHNARNVMQARVFILLL